MGPGSTLRLAPRAEWICLTLRVDNLYTVAALTVPAEGNHFK